MSKAGDSLKSYYYESRSLLYSYLISLPLLLLYQVLIFVSQPDPHHAVRVAVDVWVSSLFSYLGSNVVSITLIVAALLGAVILIKERRRLPTLRPRYFALMLGESFIYACSLALLLSIIVGAIVQLAPPGAVQSLSAMQKVALSLGAGLYEELFFRVILVSALVFVFNYFIGKKLAYVAAMIAAALLFSAVHYIGTFGDAFTFGSYLFRFLFGLALNAIYLWRGFGTAAWSHAIYDIMVVVFG